MKPRLVYSEEFGDPWLRAFDRIIARGVGAKLTAGGVTYRLKHWNPDTEYAWVILRSKEGDRMCRRGDVLMLELQPA